MNDQSESPLNNRFSSCGASKPGTHADVFLPGWGFDGRIITLQNQVADWLFPAQVLSPADTLPALADCLEQKQITSITLTGWSMGAYLALDFALQHPEKIEALYLLAMRKSWPEAEIERIRRDLHNDRNAFMQTFYRKCFLGYRKAHDRFKAEIETALVATMNDKALEDGLDYLAGYRTEKNISSLADCPFPTHIINGGKDIIAPVAAAPVTGNIVSITLDHAGHPLFLEQDFPFHLHNRKAAIRHKFCRAADTYDEHAIIQKKIARRLGESFPAATAKKILEIGCGTGNYTKIISDRYPDAEITAVDFAADMLRRAEAKLPPERHIRYLCHDAEIFLRGSGGDFDLITSNATMQWFDNLAASCRNIRSLLTDEGHILLSIFGPASMQEMQAGFGKIVGRPAPLPATYFPDRDKLFTIFNPLFKDLEITEWQTTRNYSSMAELLEHIRKTGTSGWHPGRPLLTRKRMIELENWFIAEYGRCCITYQVFQIAGRKG